MSSHKYYEHLQAIKTAVEKKRTLHKQKKAKVLND